MREGVDFGGGGIYYSGSRVPLVFEGEDVGAEALFLVLGIVLIVWGGEMSRMAWVRGWLQGWLLGMVFLLAGCERGVGESIRMGGGIVSGAGSADGMAWGGGFGIWDGDWSGGVGLCSGEG